MQYVFQDIQGSTRAVMSGACIVERHDYLPFGEEIGAGTGLRASGQGYGATDTNRQKYALTERDDATGLDHTWWRKYENTAGRWTSSDPLGGSIGDPQSFNRYAYVENDPVNFVDPSGLDDCPIDPATGRPRCISPLTGFNVTINISSRSVIGGGGAGRGFHSLLSRGGARTEPQEPAKPSHSRDTRTDCERFADRVAGIASKHNDVRGFMDELARTFIGVASSDVDVMSQGANISTGEYFSSTGFGAGLFDNLQDNQARHFMGGLIAGYNSRSVTLATAVMNWGEDSAADRRVNDISIPLGANLTNPRAATQIQASRARDDIRYKNVPAHPGFKALSEMIRNQVCNR